MDRPPAQDSTKNILNVLNDDCIEEIFRRIFCLEDFLNMADVCQRFQQNAKNCFRMQFKHVYLNHCHITGGDFVPSERVIPFLNTFGPFIHGLKLIIKPQTIINLKPDDIFKSIVKFTSATLKELYIGCYNPDFAQTQFSALEVLRLFWSIPKNFEQVPSLKELEYMYDKKLPNFMRTISQLESLSLLSSVVTDDIIIDLLPRNPQLKRLNFRRCYKLTPLILKHIADNSRDLVELSLRTLSPGTSSLGTNLTHDMVNTNLQYLGALKQLKYIEIELCSTILFQTMIHTFAENDVPIESMKIDLKNKGPYIIRNSKLPTIKTLKYLDFIKFPRENCFSELMVNIVKTQTALESIKMACCDEDLMEEQPIPMLEIINVLKYGKKLSEFEFHVILLDVNLESYESLLRLVKNRVRTKIIIGHVNSNCIPHDVLAKNEYESEWLEIRYLGIHETNYRIGVYG